MEAGRVAYVNYGEDYGKLVVIVDIADMNRVLVDGADFPRVIYPLRRLTLTKLKINILRGARTGTVLKAIKEADLLNKWAQTPVAKKQAQRSTRSNLNDLERFQVMINRKRRSYVVRQLAKKALKK